MPLLDASGLIDGPATETLLPNTTRVADLTLDGATLLAVEFPGFGDGRGFSIAQELRAAGYRGRLRASGQLLPDQFAYALDCGFDEVEIDAERLARQPVEQWLAALAVIPVSYHQSGRLGPSIFARRAAARA